MLRPGNAGANTGLANLPFHSFAHNAVWLELSLIAHTQHLALDGELADPRSGMIPTSRRMEVEDVRESDQPNPAGKQQAHPRRDLATPREPGAPPVGLYSQLTERSLQSGPHLGAARAAMLDLQRHAGNQATVEAVRRAASNPETPLPSRSRAPVSSTAPLSIQRNIGVEVEIVEGDATIGMALSPLTECKWKKRDVIVSRGTWDLTLDDTPGEVAYNRAGKHAKDGPYRKFNLEFNLHGGGGKKGFTDGDSAGLLDAMTSIEAFCKDHGGEKTIEDASKGPLTVFYPQSVPEYANIQLTAGASLAGLQAVLAGNWPMMGRAGEEGENPLVYLAGQQARENLARAYVSPEEVAKQIRYTAKSIMRVPVPDLEDEAIRSLSAMLTIIKTFLTHQDKKQKAGNIKEATPLLWKTPLNLFFNSADLEPHRNKIVPLWSDLMEVMFDDFRDPIRHPPDTKKPIDVLDWLTALPTRDLLSEADADWDKSFGGMGALEGGAQSAANVEGRQGSAGQPIIEFRAMPSRWVTFKERLEQAVDTLSSINKSAAPSERPLALSH